MLHMDDLINGTYSLLLHLLCVVSCSSISQCLGLHQPELACDIDLGPSEDKRLIRYFHPR